jgi:uncharacterized protein Yka (UPF0111/DUF47 family)
MRHFVNKREAIYFALRELLDTLRDDLARMETVQSRQTLANKIRDIEEAEDDMHFTFREG